MSETQDQTQQTPEHINEIPERPETEPENPQVVPESAEAPPEGTETVPSAADVALKELLSECRGAACEVQSEDNYLFFAGHVAQQDPDFKVVAIEPRRGSEAPLGVEHGTPVKVQVRVRTEWGNLVMLSHKMHTYSGLRHLLCRCVVASRPFVPGVVAHRGR